MNWTLRRRFFAWMTVHTLLVFFFLSGVLYAFNRMEALEHPDLREEEEREAIVLAAFMFALLPFSLVGAWLISGRLLRPIQGLVEPAERIGDGLLDERLQTPVATDELGRLAASLNRAFDRHREVRARLQRFSADAAHQLRNPLSAIRTRGEVCLQHPRTPDVYVDTIGDMLDSSRRLGRTVEQLLLLADASSQALAAGRQPCELATLLDEVIAETGTIAEAKGVRLEYTRPSAALSAVVIADLLCEAAANLIDNALKFTPEGGTVSVSLEALVDGMYRVTVRDSGPGVPPAQRAALFRPFRKGEPDSEGVGLGLAIVADIATAHGGIAGMNPAPGGGSDFWFTFAGLASPR